MILTAIENCLCKSFRSCLIDSLSLLRFLWQLICSDIIQKMDDLSRIEKIIMKLTKVIIHLQLISEAVGLWCFEFLVCFSGSFGLQGHQIDILLKIRFGHHRKNRGLKKHRFRTENGDSCDLKCRVWWLLSFSSLSRYNLFSRTNQMRSKNKWGKSLKKRSSLWWILFQMK